MKKMALSTHVSHSVKLFTKLVKERYIYISFLYISGPPIILINVLRLFFVIGITNT